jgi:hypothetical protein
MKPAAMPAARSQPLLLRHIRLDLPAKPNRPATQLRRRTRKRRMRASPSRQRRPANPQQLRAASHTPTKSSTTSADPSTNPTCSDRPAKRFISPMTATNGSTPDQTTPQTGAEQPSAVLGEITAQPRGRRPPTRHTIAYNRINTARTSISQTGRIDRQPGAIYKPSLPPKNGLGPRPRVAARRAPRQA